jgi:hypothetical protein
MGSIQQALIAQSQKQILESMASACIEHEVAKGCSPAISACPVALEPHYEPLRGKVDLAAHAIEPHFEPERVPKPEELIRFQVWVSPDQRADWSRSEAFLKQLSRVGNRLAMEVSGNSKGVSFFLLCHHDDQPVVLTAFRGTFDRCDLSPAQSHPLFDRHIDLWSCVRFRDCYPPPPYSHLFTRPDELSISPYEPFATALGELPETMVGFYQVVFQPVRPAHNWHRNVEVLLDVEYTLKLWYGDLYPQRYAQQSPSGDLRTVAWEIENKAHNDKAFYSMALRIAVISHLKDPVVHLDSLSTSSNLFQHGGRPLGYLTEEDYAFLQTPDQVREMFHLGLTYRPGFLVNSKELTGPVHIPPAGIIEHRRVPMQTLETLPVRDERLLIGTPIGTCDYAGKKTTVCVPLDERAGHCVLIGATNTGKSNLIKHMALDDISKGIGVAILDPHGDLVKDMLALIPPSAVERTIYFNPGDPEWIPIWNPLILLPGQDKARLADDLVGAFKRIVAGWGDRLAHLLRNSFYSLLHLPKPTLFDAWNLLTPKCAESDRLLKDIFQVVENPTVLQFWRHDFKNYRPDEVSPAKHKLGKLLGTDSVQLMLSQPDSRFNLRQIMDQGLVFLADLSKLGSELREVLGSFLLTLLHQTALSRENIPPDCRKLFSVFIDEVHRFTTTAIEDIVNETRKYGVTLTVAFQQVGQLPAETMDALASANVQSIFRLDSTDARRMTNSFRDRVRPEDITSLNKGEAIARIGSEVVRIKTLGRLEPSPNNSRDRIIAESRQRYYRPARELHEIMNRGTPCSRYANQRPPFDNGSSGAPGQIEEFFYDTFGP